jgi:hypothetical protein
VSELGQLKEEEDVRRFSDVSAMWLIRRKKCSFKMEYIGIGSGHRHVEFGLLLEYFK